MKKDNIVFVWILMAFVVFISFYFDSEIVKIISLMRGDVLNDFFMMITFLSNEIIVFSFLTILFLWKEHKRKWILPLWFTLALSVGISFLLKFAVQRQRPFQLGFVSTFPVLEKASHLVWNFSFPSFQAMLVFCAIPLLSKKFPKFKNIWIIFAILVAFSRVYFGLHFMSDIIVGGLIGYVLGAVIIKLEEENKWGKRIYEKVFKK